MFRRLVLGSALVVGLVAGCADAPTTNDEGNPADSSAAPSATGGATQASGSGTTAPGSEDASDTQTVRVYFSRLEGTSSCSAVEVTPRQVAETEAVATAALNELFAGPTEAEEQRGLSSMFSADTKDLLRHVHVADGTAYLDLNRSLLDIDAASTSCGGTVLMAQIEHTLEQFTTVDGVRYAVEGEPRTYYEFLQIGCPTPSTAGDRCDPEPFRR
jgi:spore germination protein GerM